MTVRRASLLSLAMASPRDTSALAAAVGAGRIRVEDLRCLWIKTEGNGLDNDFSRDLALTSVTSELRRHAPHWSPETCTLIASGGCEGVLSPHLVALQVSSAPSGMDEDCGPALAVGRAVSRDLLPEEIGTLAQAHATADAVRQALYDAGLAPADAALIQIRAAVVNSGDVEDAARRGAALAYRTAHESKPATRVATALGAALALAELAPAAVARALETGDRSKYCRRALVTPGSTDRRNHVLAFGQARGWVGPHRVASGVLADLIDSHAVARTAAELGLHGEATARIDAVLVKADPPSHDEIRGFRHVLGRDSDIQAPRHVRAALGGLIAGVLGTTRIFAAGGAEHQGPDGGGVLAIFARAA